MRDLQKAFDHEMKMYHFLAQKGVIRINKFQEAREERQKKEEEEKIQKEFDIHSHILDEVNVSIKKIDKKYPFKLKSGKFGNYKGWDKFVT